ncbi:hypothetical protein [Paenibacillus wenxiniae]|uniref:IDEAL domain-containing protein n=1 Tax=Paenibacillus wenxiniae TaxID=1636843 RepID=A0ABW4RIL7_9BACL
MFSKYEIEEIEDSKNFFASEDVQINGVKINCFDTFYHLVHDKTYIDHFTVQEIESLEEQLGLYQDFILSLNGTFNEKDKQLYFKLEQILKNQKSKLL